MLRLFAIVYASLLLSPLYAASSECKKPSLFSADYEKSEEGISLYFSDWIDYENCMIEDIQHSENFLDFRDRFKEFYICAPDYTVAFNEWDISLISERSYYKNMDFCNERDLMKLDKLLNAVWIHIKELNGGDVPETLLLEQRAWLKYYNSACHNEDDHPFSLVQQSYCQKREIEFRILSLSKYIGEGGDAGWPADSMLSLLNEMSIQLPWN